MRVRVRVSGGTGRVAGTLEFPLIFEGQRAFLLWESSPVANYELQARIELNPKLLRKVHGQQSQFRYTGKLELPRPQDN